MPRRDQGLAVTAWTLIDNVPPDVRDEFRTRAMELGPMLANSGLAATAAFLAAKAGSEAEPAPLARAYRILADALSRHVLGDPQADRNRLVVELGQFDAAAYRRVGAGAREFAGWVRRAAEALVVDEPT
jgi:CRISPR type III-B/RAMP module-associated protein Cmr5